MQTKFSSISLMRQLAGAKTNLVVQNLAKMHYKLCIKRIILRKKIMDMLVHLDFAYLRVKETCICEHYGIAA